MVSIEYLRRVWHADRGRVLLRTPGPVPLGLAYVLLVETNPFPNLSLLYRTMLFEYPMVLSRSSPAYGVFISQLIRYARACSSYECFILRAKRLSRKLLKQGYLVERLKSSFRKFYGRYGDLIEQYEVTLSRMLNDILTLEQQ